ncbi:MAG: hypothetical protein OXG97_19095 [Candidatus Poribacteria bacterium]|nr:hypothetical protein [Candidatus Poribacteria bacterium]
MLKDIFFRRVVFGTLLLVVVIIAGGILYLKHLEAQMQREIAGTAARVKLLPATPVATQTASALDVIESADGGHFHADGTWHADAHTPGEQSPVAEMDSGETWREGVWYPENYTQADIAADLAGRGAMTDEEYDRRAYKYAVNAYIQKHKKEYPDCTEYQAVIDDAKRYAAWRRADQDYWDKYYELVAESDEFAEDFDGFIEKYGGAIFDGEEISLADARNMQAAAKAYIEKINAQSEQTEVLERERPIEPRPRHTH